MRILHINTYDKGGGAEQFASDLMLSQSDSNLLVKKKLSAHKRVHAFKRSWLDKGFTLVDMVLWKVGIKHELKRKLFLTETLNYTFKKLSELDEYRNADIIHLHNIHGSFFDLNALSKIAKEKPIVWTMHDMWLMTGGEAHTFDFMGYQIGDAKSPYIDTPTLNSPWIDRRKAYLNKKKRILKQVGNRITLVPVSGWLLNCLRSSYAFNNSQNNIALIRNGVDISTFYNKEKRDWDKPRILFFNSKNKFKGSECFLQVINKIEHDCEVWVVGEKLNIESSKVVINHLKHIGDRVAMNELYNSVDVLIFPSLAENLPLTVLEALAAGVYVIASNVGGIPEIIQNNNLGTLFKAGDSEDLIQNVDFYCQNKSHFRSFANERSSHICNNFSWQTMVSEYENLYQKILNNG